MKRSAPIAAICLLVLGAAWFGVHTWMQNKAVSQLLAGAAPARPDLAGLPPELSTRLASCEDIISEGPDRLDALKELSRLYHANGFFSEATQCYGVLIQAEPKEGRWPHLFAEILAGFGQLPEAIELWKRAVELEPGHLPAWIRLGDSLLKQNDTQEAKRVYEAILRSSPQNAYALAGMGRIAMRENDWRAAKDLLERAAQESGMSIGADLLVTAYEKLQMPAEAKGLRGRVKAAGAYYDPPDEWLNDVFEDCYDAYRLAVAAGIIARGGDRARGLRFLQRAVALSPKNAALHYQLAGMLLAGEDRRGAQKSFERCVELDPTFSDGWIQLIELHKAAGQQEAVERTLALGLVHCPKSPALHLERGRRLASGNRWEDALKEFQLTIELRPEEAEAYVEMAKVYFQLEQLQEASEVLQRALQAEPGNPIVLSTLALYYISVGNEPSARETLQEAFRHPRIQSAQRTQLSSMYRDRFGRALGL